MSNREEGAVGYDVDVSAGGKPLRCAIVKSSGSKALDQVTCPLVLKRSAFIPSVDAEGRRVAGIYRGWLTWRIG